jgi:hypothetical protein
MKFPEIERLPLPYATRLELEALSAEVQALLDKYAPTLALLQNVQ